jgi:dTDP-4-dehydrorhamnose 3,5-epimerase-like enzyme
MTKIPTPIHGLYILDSTLRSERQMPYDDVRGSFQKLFNAEWFKENGLECDFKEYQKK